MSTKTKTDPVAEAEAALLAATETLDAAKEHDRQLRQKVLDGEATVTAQDLADSGMNIEHATLGADAARQRYQRAQDTARLDRLRELRAEIYAAGSSDEMSAAMRTAVEGLQRIIGLCATRRDNNARWLQTMIREGITNGRDVSDDNAGLGWFSSDWDLGGLVLDDHQLRVIPAEMLIGSALLAAAEAAGEPASYLGATEPPHNREQREDPEAWARKRWGSL